MLKKTHLLGVGITNETIEKILEYLSQEVEGGHQKLFIVTPNPEMVVYATKHVSYKKTLNEAKIALPDGIGVFVACGILGNRLKERIPGVDFIEEVCQWSYKKPLSIGFLGGKPGVAQRTAERLLQRYPWIKVRWVGEEWEKNQESRIKNRESRNISSQKIAKIQWNSPHISKDDPIDILFVAFGFPKQEEWIFENLEHLPVKAAMGVGGAFDYISEEVIRAPYLIRAMGFEWLFRLIRQPWRVKRQLALIEFIYLVLKERLRK